MARKIPIASRGPRSAGQKYVANAMVVERARGGLYPRVAGYATPPRNLPLANYEYALAADAYTDSTGAIITVNPDGSITSPGVAVTDPGYAQEVNTLPGVTDPAAAPIAVPSFLHSPLGRAAISGAAASIVGKMFGLEGGAKTLLVASAAYMGWKGEFDLLDLIF